MRAINPKAVYLLSTSAYNRIYGEKGRKDIAGMVETLQPVLTAENWREHKDVCAQAEIILSGWGMPVIDREFLDAFPRLRVILYGAGSIKHFATDVFWESDIQVSSASDGNAVPVCEFVVSQIVLSMKNMWRLSALTHALHAFPPFEQRESPGMYKSVVGLISLGKIGRMVAHRLQQFEIDVIAYDPMVSPLEARSLGVELCSLEELFQHADVVSCHAPLIAQTEHMITVQHFASMKNNATFINTSRGMIVDEEGMIQVLQKRPDIYALLDVTFPEPPPPCSPLYSLPNVRLTPHIAGSKGKECQRMGRMMIDELQRYLTRSPLKYSITKEQSVLLA